MSSRNSQSDRRRSQPIYSRARRQVEFPENLASSTPIGKNGPIVSTTANSAAPGHDPFEFEDADNGVFLPMANPDSSQDGGLSSQEWRDEIDTLDHEFPDFEDDEQVDGSDVDLTSSDDSEEEDEGQIVKGRGRSGKYKTMEMPRAITMNVMPTTPPFSTTMYGAIHENANAEFKCFLQETADGSSLELRNDEDQPSAAEGEIDFGNDDAGNAIIPDREYSCDIYWSAAPPSPEEEASYNLPCGAPDMIQLSPAMEHLKHNTENAAAFFNAIFMDEILGEIVTCTNNYGVQVLEDTWKPLDIVELRAFIGAMIYIGESGLGSHSWDELFKVSCYRVNLPLIRTFGRDRFKQIHRFLRFDDKVHRTDDTPATRIRKIEDVFNYVIAKLRDMFTPSKYLTVDESTISYRGNVNFKVYNPMKPDPYGMKISALCDASGPILNAQVYTGKTGDKAEVGQGARVVRELATPYAGSGRVITTDRFYTGIELARQLFEEDGLLTLGTIKPNRKGIPVEFQNLNLHQHYDLAPKPKKKDNKSKEQAVEEEVADQCPAVPAITRGRGRGRGRSRRYTRAVQTSRQAAAQAKRERLKKLEETIKEYVGSGVVTTPPLRRDDDNVSAVIFDVMSLARYGIDPATEGPAAKKTRADIPQSAFLFSDYLTLVKYEPTASNQVHVLSTAHHRPYVADDVDAKPLAVLDYNRLKVGVDVLDQMVNNYSTVRGCRRWTMRMFAWLVDATCISASTAYTLAKEEPLDRSNRRSYLQKLATELMKPVMRRREAEPKRRAHTRKLSKMVVSVRTAQKKPYAALDESIPLQQSVRIATTPVKPINTTRTRRDLSLPIPPRNKPRCYVCAKKTTRVCDRCGNPSCLDHSDMEKRENKKFYYCKNSPASYCIRNRT